MFDYFHWGIYQDSPIALYLLSHDCFLWLAPNSDIANRIRLIALNRYALCSVRVDLADNYSDCDMDNSCCSRWTIANQQHLKNSSPYNLGYTITATSLVKKLESTPELTEEQQFIALVQHWLFFIDRLKRQYPVMGFWLPSDETFDIHPAYQLEHFMLDMVGPLDFSTPGQQLKDLETDIMRYCFYGRKLKKLDDTIRCRVNQCDFAREALEKWQYP